MEHELIPSDIFKNFLHATVSAERNKANPASKDALVKRLWKVAEYDVCVVTSRSASVALLDDAGTPQESAVGYDRLIQEATYGYCEGGSYGK